ncbi:hypothetical protein B0A50_02744 [Salinomyces thailandicus]|uniref:Purine-cytosine permease n=1 Tax=Salinomyces thailandicus TaxID=706561 RepID=A0A4U0U736_9PEZI|nr:hypothetical protein B0A50_02744 [Salinomyces thailandica]
MAVATLSTGMVGPSMGLAFWDSLPIIVVTNLISCLLPGFFATFGLTGLRMTTFSRFSFGYWGNFLVVVFSMVSTTGCVTAGTGAAHFDGFAVETPTGEAGAARALSFIAVIFSFAVSWTNCAADYNVRMPINTVKWKLFLATYVGICLPAILVQTLGAAIYSGAQGNPSWEEAYKTYGVGGPLALALKPAGGFGKFLMALAGLSSIPNNIPNNYSFALHAMNAGPWAARVPRIAFVTVGFGVAIIVGCLASLSFESSLQTFLSIIGYWTIIHIVFVLEEHIIFRKCRWDFYDLDTWSEPALLPFGWGAMGAFCFGFVGAALGMNVSWYTSPIGGLIGNGANIGLELTLGFSALAFPVLRGLEVSP